jgi:hypothetical protein
MPDVRAHPTAQQLALFGHGKLPQAQAAAVAAHLETCADCRQAVANLPPDSFLGKVQAAKPDAATLPPEPARPDAVRGALSGAVQGVPNLPPELAGHPKFRILRELGRGGMGVIYLAEHRVMDKPVALKVISPSVLDNPTAVARFLGEVRAAGKLDHQNIARAYDADQAGGLHFLVMEYVEGQSLAQVLEKRGPLPVAGACHCACQAALGLQHAFEKGMAHRDVKPQNLMLTPKGVVKVLDFGLARLRGERKGGGGLTEADSFMGTPEYVAPEQATDARSADTRSDIYSLGCTLYALLTGRPPFREETMVKLVLAHIEKEPKSLNEVRPDVPAEVAAVVARMLAKDPARRYQRPVEVAQALAPFAKGGAKVRVPGAAPKAPAPGSAGAGTVVGGDTSRVVESGVKAPKLPAIPPEPTEAQASPFAGLDDPADAAPPTKKAKKGRATAKPEPAPWWKRRAVLAAGGAGVALVLALAILSAAGVFRLKTADGTILIVEVNEPNPDVFVDGEKVTVTWDAGGKKAEVRVKPGTRKVEVTKDGFTAYGEEVDIKDGTRRILTARLGPAGPAGAAPDAAQGPGRDTATFFNGKSLVGWDYLPGYWGVKDGAIVGTCALDKPLHTFLCSSKSYKDFDLKFKVRRKDGRGATAVQFRSQVMDRATFSVLGPYCEIGAPHAAYPPGSLLMEPIAAFKPVKAREAVAAAYRDSDFNGFHIRCAGKHVTIHVNGVTAIDSDYPDIPDEGIIAWQFNGWRPPSEVTFKDIGFTDLSKDQVQGTRLPDKTGAESAASGKDFVPLFNGKDLTGWHASEGTKASWRVDGGALVGSGEFGYLITDRSDFENFRLQIEARLGAGGDSGLCFHVQDPRVARAYEAQIGADWPGAANTGSFVLFHDRGPSLLAGAPQAVPPGQWFTMEVLAEGNRFTIWVDGKQAVQYEDKERYYSRGAISLQHIGPKSEVSFRNVEIKELK